MMRNNPLLSEKMTKKMIHTVDGDGKMEFLIPSSKDIGFELIGTVSGNSYRRAMIVFTGMEMSSSFLVKKAEAIGLNVEQGLYELLLEQLPDLKISKNVVLEASANKFFLVYE